MKLQSSFKIEFTPNQAAFIDGYIGAFYFADTGEDGQPEKSAEFAPETLQRAVVECLAFLARCSVYLEQSSVTASFYSAGSDFYYTRCGHGVGFWDDTRGYGPYHDMLTTLAGQFENVDFYTGDDGLIYS